MKAIAANRPFDLRVPLDARALREALERGEYVESNLLEILRHCGHQGALDRVLLRHRLNVSDAFSTLMRLFYLGETVDPEPVGRALAPVPPSVLLRTGLLRRRPAGVASTAKLVPHRSLWLLGDFQPEDRRRRLPADHVLGVGAASVTLAALTVRRPFETALDVGTGAGVQALLAAAHCRRVVGTDTSRRALNFAAMNARLNDLDRVEWRAGDFFDPAGEERFDLIVCNPPFVISPENRFAFRDGGMGDDEVSERVLRRAPRHLRPAGFAILLINWHHRSEDDWADRPRQWLAESGCDAWLLRFRSADPLIYAAEWLRPTEDRDPRRYARRLDSWLHYYASRGIGRIAAGAAVLRRRIGPNPWMRWDTLPMGHHVGECGDQIERVFAAEDLLGRLDTEEDWLDLRPELHPEHDLEHRLRFREGSWRVQSMTLKPSQGLILSGAVDLQAMRLLSQCDGKTPVRELVTRVAAGLGVPVAEAAPACREAIRKLLRSGLLQAT